MRVAALDDDATQLELIQRTLTSMGHDCHGFTDSRSYLRSLRRESYDLVLARVLPATPAQVLDGGPPTGQALSTARARLEANSMRAVFEHAAAVIPAAGAGSYAFGLLLTILLTLRANPSAVATSVGLYITAAYWFTASTSFANPAVTIARALSDTFAGIRPADVAPFILAQFAGAVAAAFGARWLSATKADR